MIAKRQPEIDTIFNQYFPHDKAGHGRHGGDTLLNGWQPESGRVRATDILFNRFPNAKNLFDGEGSDDDSAREYGLSNYALKSGWSDPEIADLLVAARENVGQEAKAKSYYENTIRNARSSCKLLNESRNDISPKTGLQQYLAKNRGQGTDNITIGSVNDPTEAIRGSTMAEAAKRISGIRYLLRSWIAFAMVTGVIAEPGIGKSAFVLFALVRTIVTGCNWFNQSKGPTKPGYVLWCATENDMAITLQRLKDWKIPMDNIVLPFDDDPLASVNLTNPEHLERIEQLINLYKIQLVVIDSLRGAHGDDENNSRVGQVLQALSVIAERTKAAIVVVHHTKKLMVDEELTANSSRGSNAILAMMRSQIGIDQPDKKSKWCRVRVLKENLGIAPEPVGFLVTSTGLEFGAAPTAPQKKAETKEVADWLRTRLKDGKWHHAGNLLKLADDYGYKERTIKRAATEIIQVKRRAVHKDGKIDHHLWKLPTTKPTKTSS